MRRLILCGCLALAGCGGAGEPAPRTPPLPPLIADRPHATDSADTASAAAPDEPLVVEAVSLFGEALYRTSPPAEVRAEREARLAEAQAGVDAYPNEPAADALLRLGRSLADLERYREAIEVFGRGVARFPEDPRFLRHRGHRYITIRRFDLAIADLEKAVRLIQGKPDEPEPGALPAVQAEPAFTLHGTIWYHLGLARYLSGDFAGAADAFRESLARAHQPDSQVASSQWLYMSLRRLGRDVSDVSEVSHVSDVSDTEARRLLDPIANNMAVLENRPYHWLLLMEKGEMPPESLLGFVGQDDFDPSTLGYGVGAWYLAAGKKEEAVRLFRLVLSLGQWMAFGHIAAEADLKRMGVAPRVGG